MNKNEKNTGIIFIDEFDKNKKDYRKKICWICGRSLTSINREFNNKAIDFICNANKKVKNSLKNWDNFGCNYCVCSVCEHIIYQIMAKSSDSYYDLMELAKNNKNEN